MPSSSRTIRVIIARLSVALTLVGLLGLAFFSTLLSTPVQAAAGINPQMNFQGRLLNAAGAVVPDGSYNIEFKLYTGGTGCVSSGSSPCGGTNVWTEDWVYGTGSPDNRVVVRNGYFSVSLGALSSLAGIDFNNDTLWTSINIGNTTTAATFGAASGDGEMLPFKRLASSPYAFNAGKLGGLAANNFLQLANGVQNDASTANASLFVNKTGITASILDLQRGGADVMLTNNSGQVLFRPTVDAATALQVQKAGTTTVVFTVDSTNSRIGIGTGAPAYAVDAVGSVNASTSLKVAGTDVCTSSGCTVASGSTSYIQNGVGLQSSANFNISGSGTLATSVITPVVDTASAVALNVGSTASVINLNKTVVVAASQSLTLTGSGARPGSPTEGMIYYDTTLHSMIVYNGGKWVSYAGNTATKIVATSAVGGTSTAVASQNPDGADFVNASTTSAQTVINAAIAALPATGGSIYLMDGTYIVDGSINVPNNVMITGAGAATIIKIKNSTNASLNVITNSDTSTGTKVTIQNLRIDGNKANQATGAIMVGIYFTNMGGSAGAGARDGGKITNVFVSNMYNTLDGGIGGIHLVLSNNNTITGNTASIDGVEGISLNWSSNNTITGNTTQGNGGDGINLYNTSTNNTITGNTAQGDNSDIHLNSSNNNTITGNTTQGAGNKGIFIDTASGNTITGNTAQGNNIGIYLISATNNTITGNTASGNSAQGILLSSSNNNTIGSNNIYNNGGATINNGIFLTGATANTITGNDITDTACSTTCYAINVSDVGSVNNYLADNRHSGSAANPSTINDAGTGTIYANQLDGSGNLINNSQGGGFTVGASSAAASLSLQGGLKVTALTVPTLSATVTNVGTPGAVTHRYEITALDGLGETTGSTIQQTTTGNATLSGTNYNTITWGDVGGAYQYRIYRCTGAACTPLLLATVAGNTNSYNDQANGAPSGAVPVANTTGGGSFAGLLQGTSATLAATGSLTVGTASSATGQIAFKNAGNTGTVTVQAAATAGSFTVTIPAETGTVCTTAVGGACSALGFYIQNQNAGAQASANFNISGSGTMASVISPSIDVPSAGTLTIGGATANAISIGNGAAPTTVQGSLFGLTSLTLAANYSTASATRLLVMGNMTSSSITSINGIQNNINIIPNGGSLSGNIYGLINTPTIGGSNYAISNAVGAYSRLDTLVGYTGQLTNGIGFQSGPPSIVGTNKITNYMGIQVDANATNGGNTSGTINNYGLKVLGNTTAAGALGTLNNYSGYLQMSSAAGAGTTNNYGLYITGGAAGAGQFSLDNVSTASSSFAGNILLQTTNDANNALEVKSSVGTPVFIADTSSQKVGIGAYTAGSIVGQLEVLPNAVGRVGIRIEGGAGGTYNADYLEAGSSVGLIDMLRLQANGNLSLGGTTVASFTQSAASTSSSAMSLASGAVSGATSNSGGVGLMSGNSTTSGNTGSATVQSGIATSGNSGNVSVDSGPASGTTGGVYIGTANTKVVTIGNTTGATAVNINAGTVGVVLQGTGGNVGIGVSSPTSVLQVLGVKPSIVAGAGTPALNTLAVTAGGGGDTSGTTGQTGGTGGSINLTSGNGGAAPAGSNNGWGGNITLQAGSRGIGLGASGIDGTIALNPNGIGVVTINGASTFGYQTTINGSSYFTGPINLSGTSNLVVKNSSNAYTVTVVSGVTASNYQLTLPTALGASGSCLKDTTGTGVLGFGSCSGGGVTLQGSTPGVADTGNFRITGTGIASILQATTFDTASGVALNIGTTNATAINLKKTASIGASNVTTSPAFLYMNDISNSASGNAAITGDWQSAFNWGIGPNSNASDQVLRVGITSAGAVNTWSTTNNLNLLVAGTALVQPTSGHDSTTAFQVQNAAGTPVLNVDTTNQLLTVQAGTDTATMGSNLAAATFAAWTHTNWTLAGGNTTATHNTGNLSPLTDTTVTPTIGSTYQVDFTLSGACGLSTDTILATFGGVTLSYSGGALTGNDCSGDYSYVQTATNNNKLKFTPSTTWLGTISGISIVQFTGMVNSALTINNASGNARLEVRVNATDSNLSIGQGSGFFNTSGATGNTALGSWSLSNNSTGYDNTAIGDEALLMNTTGSNNSALGTGALQNNLTGNNNAALGFYALQFNTTGSNNNAFGYEALQSNTTGSNNNAIGLYALSANTTGNSNEAIGYEALNSNTWGFANTAVGNGALGVVTTGGNNNAIGDIAGGNTTTGTYNTAIGDEALLSNITGSNNVALGAWAGYQDTNNLFATGTNLQYTVAIGADAQVQASNSIVLGSVDTPINVGIGTTIPLNTFSVSPLDYHTGTAFQSTTTITGVGTTWTPAMVGDQFIFATGQTALITAWGSATSLTASVSQTVSSTPGVAYRLHHIGLQVTSAGLTQAGNGLVVGSNSSTNVAQINLQLDSSSNFVDTGTCNATTNQGALYYSTSTNAIRTCQDSKWSDVVTTKDTGLIMFGVVPDSGATPGDLAGVTFSAGTDSGGPCKVVQGSANNTLRWSGCVAYSGGRRVVIPAQLSDQATGISSGNYGWVCLTGTNSQPSIYGNTTESNTAPQPTFSATAPVLCLAQVKAGATTVSAIYDTRTFTTTTKQLVNVVTTATTPGMLVTGNGTTTGQYLITTAAGAQARVRGVVVATGGGTTANTMDAIIATAGPAFIKGTAGTVNDFVQTSTTAGYARTAATATTGGYDMLGISIGTFSATCTNNTDTCRTSLLVDLKLD